MMEKMNALKTALDGVCSDSIPTSTVQQLSYPVTWISIPFTQIGTTNLKHAATLSFTIPSIVPTNSREVLVLVLDGAIMDPTIHQDLHSDRNY